MMILLEKIHNSNSVGYFYTPENYPGPGMIEIDTQTGEVEVVELSAFDKQDDYPYFANKARGIVKRLWDSGEMPDRKFVAYG
ncbi:TPA: hypothetical protein TXJ06_002192 [Streptococcus suis]|uniref:hypothetical protein n=1 Tax=Streptococcus suis TaxID=1307 RepID=UPI001557C5F4|nr:hypothetical protein [Streptococcus suis]NQJ20730.1 hypothetical protein [Streptococcus suis]NQK56542.1 hypothetical protein [Streptococcus suis]NQK57374.1 hypothetical protein [Streptococcus suis]HEL1585392.1 hypothetical protein [Streptococcus suis]